MKVVRNEIIKFSPNLQFDTARQTSIVKSDKILDFKYVRKIRGDTIFQSCNSSLFNVSVLRFFKGMYSKLYRNIVNTQCKIVDYIMFLNGYTRLKKEKDRKRKHCQNKKKLPAFLKRKVKSIKDTEKNTGVAISCLEVKGVGKY